MMSLALGTRLSHLAVISVVGMYNRSSKNSHVQIRAAKTDAVILCGVLPHLSIHLSHILSLLIFTHFNSTDHQHSYCIAVCMFREEIQDAFVFSFIKGKW